MSNTSHSFEELDSLLLDWQTGAIDQQGMERIREILRNDPQARSYFIQMQMLDAAMQLESDAGLHFALAEDSSPTPASVSRHSAASRRNKSKSFWLVTALSLTVCVLAGWIVYSQFFGDSGAPQMAESSSVPERDESQEATAEGVALVTRLVNVTWAADQPALDVGDALSPGRFAISAGHAQIEFFCGATVVVEGPAELNVESTMLARVRSGRLRAHVPPAARGFSLEVDDLKVVDLGTEFGLSVSADGASVQVFDGEVELHRGANEKRLLAAGQALLRTADGDFQEAAVAPDTFVDIADLASRAQQQRSERFQRWSARSEQLRSDPRLVAYYSFDQAGDWERRLACSNLPDNPELDGAIVGAREAPGRWDAKRALEFKRPADRVRVQIPGEFRSLTLACWAKIDSLDRWYNSLFLTDGYDKGEPHWQILDNGQMYFSVRPAERDEPGPRDYKALSPSFWEPSLNGKWIHLAVTCNVDERTIVHYLNGQELSRHVVPQQQMPVTTRIGAASIGNWALPTMPDARFAIRNLNGSIDEFVILGAALSAEEIQQLYDDGRP